MALTGSLLTAVPFTPAGLGIVEVGNRRGPDSRSSTTCRRPRPLTIVVVDRAISVLSVVILGGIAYVVSPMRRGTGVTPIAPTSETALSA